MWRFWAKNCRRDHLRSWWRSVMLVTVRRWQRSEVAEGRWEVWPSVGLRSPWRSVVSMNGPSCRFVMKFRKVVPVPIFQEFKCFETKTLDGPSCLWRPVIHAVEGNEESNRRNWTSMGRRSPWRSIVTTTIRREVRRPNRVLTDFKQI